MLEEIKNIKSEKSDLRKFEITFSIILLVIAGFLFWKEKGLFQIFQILVVEFQWMRILVKMKLRNY